VRSKCPMTSNAPSPCRDRGKAQYGCGWNSVAAMMLSWPMTSQSSAPPGAAVIGPTRARGFRIGHTVKLREGRLRTTTAVRLCLCRGHPARKWRGLPGRVCSALSRAGCPRYTVRTDAGRSVAVVSVPPNAKALLPELRPSRIREPRADAAGLLNIIPAGIQESRLAWPGISEASIVRKTAR
jgi:hypothetical protein